MSKRVDDMNDEISEYFRVKKDGEVTIINVVCQQDDFLDLLNALTEKGYVFELITKEAYYYLKDEKGINGYIVRK